MNTMQAEGASKHWDFIIADILCMQLCMLLAHAAITGEMMPYTGDAYIFQSAVAVVSQLAVSLFTECYSGILRRRRLEELWAAGKYTARAVLAFLVAMFVFHKAGEVSRLHMAAVMAMFPILGYLERQALKKIIKLRKQGEAGRLALAVFAERAVLERAVKNLQKDAAWDGYFVAAAVSLDGWDGPETVSGVPVRPIGEEAIKAVSHEWIDEALVLQPLEKGYPDRLLRELSMMGITANYSIPQACEEALGPVKFRRIGPYKALSNGVRTIPQSAAMIKRAADISGALAGLALTAVIFLVVAPAIYSADPGPVFFAQDRIGRNGKVFRMYKFRSMYMDAEERKAELMDRNQMQGAMFKMEDDPRIIGSGKKDKNGKPKGIGNFIRRTSLDEFPQFWNVLKGDMSLVGWRPATVDEWEKYDLEHRIRASMKPGITGMWQANGRNEITDFEEIVRMDREYIEKWSPYLDAVLLAKTVIAVLKRKGAE